jgi:ammonia channel protein AmtB
MVAGPLYLLGSRILVYIGVDDVVDATAVHVLGGAWGIIAAGLFTSRESYSQSYYADRYVSYTILYTTSQLHVYLQIHMRTHADVYTLHIQEVYSACMLPVLSSALLSVIMH